MTILEILRLTEAGHSQRKIAVSVNCSKTNVGEIQRRCRQIDLRYEKASQMASDELKGLVYPIYSGRKPIKPNPDFDYIHSELKKHPKLNLQYMWEDYRLKDPNGLNYSQFCERYRRWKSDSGREITMHIEREPGKEMFVDWMGDNFRYIYNKGLGLLRTALEGVQYHEEYFLQYDLIGILSNVEDDLEGIIYNQKKYTLRKGIRITKQN